MAWSSIMRAHSFCSSHPAMGATVLGAEVAPSSRLPYASAHQGTEPRREPWALAGAVTGGLPRTPGLAVIWRPLSFHPSPPMDPKADSGAGATPLQFERAEFTDSTQQNPCAFCQQPLAGVYFDINGMVACAQCKAQVLAAFE